MNTEVRTLINELKRKQREANLTEDAFAELLGISRTYWFKIQKGTRKPGLKVFQAIKREFPDLEKLAFSAIFYNVMDRSGDTLQATGEQRQTIFRRLFVYILYRLKMWVCYPREK